ncbi:Glycosyl hydrolase family 10 [Planctomycetes bacterium CA13]|uniref:endo-1,4-beta-xylanase n=1 Tax=Novipirellula herctigrandis TaxID=2527986 RepID=A0A5C5YLS0_9BACT|nr:Glycosyl hydrolase family 10 [Planctomycetes bacterium CA13]
MRGFLYLMVGLFLGDVALAATGVFDGTDARTDALMQQAEQSIDEIRKGQLSLELIDAEGKPVDESVQIELVAHDFDFGTDLFGFHKLSDDNPAKLTALKAIDAVFNTVIVCDYWRTNQWQFQGTLDWESPDAGFAIADRLGKRSRYHALLFGFPRWLHHFETEEDQWRAIETRIRHVAERYGDRIQEVDVINEFINYQYWHQNPHAKYLRTTKYPDMAKPENGARVLALARKHFPTAKLVVLEANLWSVSNPVFQEIFEYHKELIRLGAPYDYIGYQAHYYAVGGMPFEQGTPKFGPRTFMMDEINRGIEQMASLGKPLVITEFNPPSRNNKVNKPNQPRISDEEIAAWESNFYTLMFSKAYMKGLSRWFTIDNLGGRGLDAGVVTEDGKLKPNYTALRHLIKEKWHTQWKGNLVSGKAAFEGFYGTYRVQVDGFQAATVDLTVDSPNQRIRLMPE